MFRRNLRVNKPAAIMAVPSVFFLLISIFGFSAPAQATSIPGAGFEDGTLTGWSIGTQTGNLGASINGNGTGVTVFSGSRLFSHGSHGSMGSPTVNGQPNPYYAPAVAAGTWNFSPKGGTYAVALQPKSQQTFSQATAALGLSGTQTSEITTMLGQQANAAGFGNGTPTDAAWITREVQLTAGVTYTMSWNYMATDYIPFNDGSITSLVPVTVTGTPVITVNNFVQSYALLGFTNPGTGDYSTNSYGSTGWQTSTYEVSITGTYKMGFVAFNLDDTALSPVLMIDDEIGTTLSCNQAGGSCVTFGGVEPNNETAPTLAPTTTAETTTTTTTTPPTTTTIPPATSLVVTSTSDDGSSGTLRWAITQANATSGGIYDSITFDVNGTITLTSALPTITQNVTITGNGRTNTIIDGNNLYRPFYVASGKSLTVSNMTLKQGQLTNGGLIFNAQGTVVATNIRFTAMSGGSAVWNNNGGSTATYTNCTFDYLNNGIAGDYGSTPQLAAGTSTWANEPDSVFGNKTYVDNCIFDHNNAGIYNYRFTKVVDSTFTNNSYAANITGLNRSQILNSNFDHNSIAIYHNAWIPTSFNMGTDNRLIDGNTFTNNNMAIYLDDGYNNNQKTPRWATVTNNSFDENGVWITYYLYNGTSNVSGNVGFNEVTNLFVHSTNVSVATTTTTTTTTSTTTTTTTTTSIPEESSTTSSSIVPEPEPETTTTEPVVVVVPVEPEPETTIPEDTTPATEETLPEETTTPTTEPDTPVETVPSEPETETTVTPSEESTPAPEEVALIIDSLPDDASAEDVANAVSDALIDATAEEAGAVLAAVFEDATAEEVVAILSAVFEDATSEEVVAILSATFADGATDEEVAAVTEALLSDGVTEEAVSTLIDVLESGVIDESQVEAVVDAILQEELNEEVATELATSAAIIQNITAEQATDIFKSVPVGELSDSEGSEIVNAVQDAPVEVKESFEEEINVFAGVFDTYVPLDSTIDVGTRRSVIAVNLVTSTVALAGAAGGLPTPSSSTSTPKQDIVARKEEEEAEEGGAIEGEGPDWIKRISIYKYENGVRVMDWKNFTKKFVYGVMASGFTLAGAVVMYFTLSGFTQQVALWGTSIAFACAMYLHMKEPDGE